MLKVFINYLWIISLVKTLRKVFTSPNLNLNYWIAYKSKSLSLWMKQATCSSSMLSCCFSCFLDLGNAQKTVTALLLQGLCKGSQRSKEWRHMRRWTDPVRSPVLTNNTQKHPGQSRGCLQDSGHQNCPTLEQSWSTGLTDNTWT